MLNSKYPVRAFSTFKVGVIGAGSMGTGVGIVSALNAKAEVRFLGRTQRTMDQSRDFIEKYVAREVKKGLLSEAEGKDTLKRVSFSNQIDTIREVNFVIENMTENFELKKQIFIEIEKAVPKNAVISSCTSSLSISRLANTIPASSHRFCGMHFFYPVPKMKLVEVVRGLQTDEETIQKGVELSKQMDKVPIVVGDTPAFINNRIFNQYLVGGASALAEKLGTAEDIDTTMRLALNWPMGPLELSDFCGMDICYETGQQLYEETGDNKHKPHPIMAKHVSAGYLGVKTGKGYYDHTKKKR